MTDVTTRLNDALALHGRGQVAEAALLYREILKSQPQHFDALHLLGVAHMQQGDGAAAVDLMTQAVAVNPNHGPALSNLAVALRGLGKQVEALTYFDRALALQPTSAETGYNRALLLNDLKRYPEALEGFGRVLAAQPAHADAHVGRGAALERLGNLPDAIAAYQQAFALQPQSLAAIHNLGCALHANGEIAEARRLWQTAMGIHPQLAETHLMLAESRLLTGDYAQGWPAYEWRWRVDGMMAAQRRDFTQPQWRGEDIAGRTILLWGEQGLGDMIQFCRFAALVAAKGAKVVLEATPELAGLMESLAGPAQVIVRGTPLPNFDVHSPLMSLPLALGLAEPPPSTGAYLKADAARGKAWRAKVAKDGELLVGLAWAGRNTHRNDHARSLPLARLAPLFAVPGVRFVALQLQFTEADRACGFPVVAPGPESFAEAAALADAVDLVITVDTAFAHLAGALGKETWVLLHMTPDWRWQLDRQDSEWYPTARLFRQTAPGDWSPAIADVAKMLAIRAARSAL